MCSSWTIRRKITVNFMPNSYIQNRHAMTRPEADYLRSLLRGYDEQDQAFACHVMVSNILQCHSRPDGSPIPYVAWKKKFPKANPFELRPFIEVGEFRIGRCREYRWKDEFIREYLEITDRMSIEEYSQEPKVYFETMRKVSSQSGSRMYDENRNEEPPLIQEAMSVLDRNRGYFNGSLIEAHVQKRRHVMEQAELNFGPDSKEFKAARGRYINDSSCRTSLLEKYPVHYNEDIYSFTPRWKARKTGRLYFEGGGLQSASSEMKRLAYTGLSGFKNFDAVSCQVFIARNLADRAGIQTNFLTDYLENPRYREEFGQYVGVPGSVIKQIVIALCMGAYLPSSIDRYTLSSDRLPEEKYCKNAVLDYLSEYADNREQLAQKLGRLIEVFGPLKKILRSWHRYLLDVYVRENQKRGAGGYRLPNAVGKYLSLNMIGKGAIAAQKITAHLLQGTEAAVILEMIARSDEANFTPISCEHDGFIISSGEPDLILWDEITRKHGLAGLQLVPKDL